MIRLGSNSPTRAKILKDFKIDFIQNGGSFDEDSIKTKNPKEFCYLATKGKFDELYLKYGVEDIPLLVADSVVTCQ
ncbi:Maf family protein, partial [Aliarcobacter butzleri]